MDFITVLDFTGVLVFAISGIRLAAKKKFDLFGAAVIGFATALGGGTLRDVLLDIHPIFWMRDLRYIYLILLAVPLTFIFRQYLVKFKTPFFLYDTIGLALYTMIGLQKALAAGYGPTVAIMMGMITAVAGGVTRDVLLNEVPLIFRKEIYATACLAGASLYFLLEHYNVPQVWSISITTIVIITIRLLSIKYKLGLPVIKVID
ncbi:MAG: trimeric intracellular cation channel family protein [Cyclobacteriaceae bacterium]|nr:trimeric intracellular cation channel family protein [Cyclobacteriaceae bacterium]